MQYTNLPPSVINGCRNNSQAARDAYARIASQFKNEGALIAPNTLIERQTVYRLIQILDEGNEYSIVDEIETLIQQVLEARPTRVSRLRETCNRIVTALDAVERQCRLIYNQVHVYDDDTL